MIDPGNWVIDKALIDRPGIDEIMLDLLYDIPNQAPTFKAMREFLRDRRLPTLVATGPTTRSSPKRPADRSSPTTRAPSTTRCRPATSRWKTRQPRSPR